jgi:hypothetical protein
MLAYAVVVEERESGMRDDYSPDDRDDRHEIIDMVRYTHTHKYKRNNRHA